MEKTFTLDLEGKNIEIKINNWTPQASGSCLVKCGETEVLVTSAISSHEIDNNFLPLIVDYEEKYYAAREIYGSRFVRRETRPTDQATLTARMIDRSIRPLFSQDIRREIQVITTCLSWDKENDPDILSLIGSSLAIFISEIPWQGPLSAIKMGKVDNEWIISPNQEQKEKSKIEITLSAVESLKEDDVLINMIEIEGEEQPESEVLEGIKKAKPYLKKIIEFQKEIQKEIGKEKLDLAIKTIPDVREKVKKFCNEKLESIFSGCNPFEFKKRIKELEESFSLFVEEEFSEKEEKKYAFIVLEEEKEIILNENVVNKNKRIDGRSLDQVREISCETGILNKIHGSGLFSRGLTKILSVLTLGGPGDYQIIEGMEVVAKKRFLLHYNFPPYSVGEVRRLRGPGRREIGHGHLAEKSLRPLIPNFNDFPYTIRIVSEALSSNGSTSMASACASSLALMDAGVPIKKPVAGIAVGLAQDSSGKYELLTDIQGPEDGYGGMDFKVAGTKDGITAIQLDVKVRGLNEKMIAESLERAKKARMEILEKITENISEPRPDLPASAPKIKSLQIPPEKIGEVVGPGGKIINKIIDDYDVEVDIEDTGLVYITGETEESCKNAIDKIESIVKEVEVGETYQGKVERIEDYGAFVEIFPGKKGLVHISKFASYRVDKLHDIINLGETVPVKVISIDEQGRINLSAVDAGFQPKPKNEKK